MKTPDSYSKEEYQVLSEQNKLLQKQNRELKKNLDTLLNGLKSTVNKIELLKDNASGNAHLEIAALEKPSVTKAKNSNVTNQDSSSASSEPIKPRRRKIKGAV